jgi:AcrR family transcriptional regulator
VDHATITPASDAGDATGAVPGSVRWWAEREQRLDRRRPRVDGVTIERIVEAAMELVDRDGLEALTVRRLAAGLNTGSATLYRHVASREELVVLLVDRVLGEVQLPDGSLAGRARVEWLAGEFRRVLLRHPNLVPALPAAPLLGPNATAKAEVGLVYLLEAGFRPEVAVPGYLALIDFVLGSVFFGSGQADLRSEDPDLRVRTALDRAVPVLDAHRDALSASNSDLVFRFGLATFLDGLEGRQGPRWEKRDR